MIVIPPPKVFAALRFTVPPAALITTLPAAEVPPWLRELLNVKVPPPARVKVLDVAEDAVVKVTKLLNTNVPPAVWDQVLLPLAFSKFILNVWVAVELFVMPPCYVSCSSCRS